MLEVPEFLEARLIHLGYELFRTRSQTKLAECRDAERRLKEACETVLKPPPTFSESLFGKE